MPPLDSEKAKFWLTLFNKVWKYPPFCLLMLQWKIKEIQNALLQNSMIVITLIKEEFKKWFSAQSALICAAVYLIYNLRVKLCHSWMRFWTTCWYIPIVQWSINGGNQKPEVDSFLDSVLDFRKLCTYLSKTCQNVMWKKNKVSFSCFSC